MLSKKFKTASLFIISFIFLFTSCFVNMSFAASDGEDNIAEGKYYINNSGYGLYMEDLDRYSCIVNSFNGTAKQRWEIIYVSDGYYYIKNVSNGKYLTAPSDFNEDSLIEQSSSTANVGDRRLWKFIPTYYGSDSYFIVAKSHENYGMSITAGAYMGPYGYDLLQGSYEYAFDSCYEWYLEEVPHTTLIGINYNSTYTSFVNQSSSYYAAAGHEVTALTPTSITVQAVKSYMTSSDVFILFSVGGRNDLSMDTYIWLNNTQTLPYLHTWDIFNYNGSVGIDMSGCKVAVFAGCYTAYYTCCLPQAAVDAGAENGIGFSGNPQASDMKSWATAFSRNYASGENVSYAAQRAVQSLGNNYEIQSIEIITQKTMGLNSQNITQGG